MRKALPSFTLWSGVLGLIITACLGLLQWRVIWVQNHPVPGRIVMDWSPYPELLVAALNWSIPVSILICGGSIFLTMRSRRSAAVVFGWCSHAVSIICVVSLGVWVFTVPLEGAASGVWWMYWN